LPVDAQRWETPIKLGINTHKYLTMLHLNVSLFSPIQENTYVVYNDDGICAIIDPGCYSDEEREELSDFISDHHLTPVLLLNTHCHLDHVFGNRYVHQTYGLELHLHPKEQRMLELAPASGLMWNMPFDNYDGPLHFLSPGEPVLLGSDKLEVLFVPGHSPGSVGFHHSGQAFIISGDVLFRGSIGRTDLPYGSFDVLEDSIRRVMYALPDETVVHSGHGPQTTIGWEKANNPYVRP
jgi:glyoxylase-like metal-dependent hydrolase (beta-lactamase superfamily II)